MPSLVRRSPLWRRPQAFHAASLLVGLLSLVAVASTHTRLSHTVDEPTHIASGLEWLESATQRLHPENPPLGRLGPGLAAWLAGRDLPASGTAPQRGVELLYAEGRYLDNLSAARRGTLPALLLTLGIVWTAAWKLAGARAALLALILTASLPPVLAHAGLATTDLPFVAALSGALWAFVAWLDHPGWRRALLLGGALGLALATKFSTLALFPAGALAILTLERVARPRGARSERRLWGRRLLGALLALPLAALVVWATYGFSIGTLGEIDSAERVLEAAWPDAGPESLVGPALLERRLPAPDAALGLLFLKAHARSGHPAYLLERRSEHGFWYFYPVALAVKTPIVFFLLCLAALVGYRLPPSDWRAAAGAAAALGVLAISLTSSVNIGLRHVLVVYPLVAVSLGIGLDRLIEDRAKRPGGWVVRLAVGLLLLLQLSLVWRAHPHYLSDFNRLAGDDPGAVLVDSDLDWGQDALELERLSRELGIDSLSIAYFGSVRLCELDLPPLAWLPPGRRVTGWVAISEMYFRDHWRVVRSDPCGGGPRRTAAPGASYDWLRDLEPVARAGRSIRVYHVER